MKLSLAALALSASSIASAYSVGGFDGFGRPYYVSPRGRFARAKAFRNGCSPPRGGGSDGQQRRGRRDSVDKAFEDLRKELNNDCFRRANPSFEVNEKTLRQQEEWVSRAFGLASDVAKGMASTPQEAKEADENIRAAREAVDSIFDFARDASSSVRSEVLQDDENAFQVALDVPGIRASDIDVTVEGTKDKILMVRGERKVGGDEEARKFSKSIRLDSRSYTDQMSANLADGVLTVTVPRMTIENTESVQKVAVNKVSEESVNSSKQTGSFPFEVEIDLPGVSASNVDITVKGDSDKTLTVTAVREMVGKDSNGNPLKKETVKSYKVDDVVDTSKIVANLSNGVLTISAPADEKKATETVQKISVKQSSDAPAPVETTSESSKTDDEGKKEDQSSEEGEAS